ncbi:phosphotransferase [Agromyces rhizosphaerae]|uniref:phosphotransferase n=1 Tax=Agromyces rhizosphaerae TaxID=88374 RepID=UPI0024903683|nr:phosphotransferase [Agromyces rhizosphaerae]
MLIDGEAAPSLFLKTVDRARDWVSIATGDSVDREVAVWETGLLDMLPSGVDHAIVAAARTQRSSSLLMHDRSAEFLAEDEPITAEWVAGVLRALAAMHAAYWEHPVLGRSAGVLCDLEQVLGHLGPARLPALRQAVPGHFIIDLIDEGWSDLAGPVGSGLARDLRSLVVDPSPVVHALAGAPRTLVHADVRPANVAFDGRRTTFVDWARPTVAPPGIDLAYLLLMSQPSAVMSPDEAIADYRAMLAASLGSDGSMSWWDDHIDLCMTAVFAMMAAVLVDYETDRGSDEDPAHARIAWWAERAEPGLRLLDRL